MLVEDRTYKKNELTSVMDDAKEQIVAFKEDIDANNEKLVNIDEMIDELKHLKNFVRNMKSCCTKESKKLDNTIDKIKESINEEIKSNIGTFIEVVRANLAYQVRMEDFDNEYTLPLEINFIENNEKNPFTIGSMNIYEEENEINANIKFSDKGENNFKIKDPYNVYEVVNCINTRYNYNNQ